MNEPVKIICENTRSTLFVNRGSTLHEIMNIVSANGESTYIAAWVDNKLKDFSYRIYAERSIRFTEIHSPEGLRIYARTLFFILTKAVADLMPTCRLKLMHHVGTGYYCEIDGLEYMSSDIITKLKVRVMELIKADLPIVRQKIEYQEAIDMYTERGFGDKVALLKTRPRFFVTIYNLAGEMDYFFGAMAASTGFIRAFDFKQFHDGLMILFPTQDNLDIVNPMIFQPKLFDVFRQNKQWVNILGIPNIGKLNEKIINGEGSEMLKIGEALQEKNFAATADKIVERGGIKLVLIAGPSSSGKTSFAKRLSVQLKVLGLKPQSISLDNYFVDRAHTPLDENGEYDFECLEAVDVKQFNHDMIRLFAGESVEMCKFSFHSGDRFYDGETLQLDPSSILIVEGIHALNPALITDINHDIVFKIYASALTTLSMDDMNVARTTDNRLLRRMVRDSKYRSRSAYETLKGWRSVRRGEDKHIFPYQENADLMFGTALFFEIPVLKKYAMPLLGQVPENVPEYAEAMRLMNFLNCFVEMPDEELPPTSILREFIGGSSFEY